MKNTFVSAIESHNWDVQDIVWVLEEQKNKILIIESKVAEELKNNPGKFPDYNPEEKVQYYLKIINENGLSAIEESDKMLDKLIIEKAYVLHYMLKTFKELAIVHLKIDLEHTYFDAGIYNIEGIRNRFFSTLRKNVEAKIGAEMDQFLIKGIVEAEKSEIKRLLDAFKSKYPSCAFLIGILESYFFFLETYIDRENVADENKIQNSEESRFEFGYLADGKLIWTEKVNQLAFAISLIVHKLDVTITGYTITKLIENSGKIKFPGQYDTLKSRLEEIFSKKMDYAPKPFAKEASEIILSLIKK